MDFPDHEMSILFKNINPNLIPALQKETILKLIHKKISYPEFSKIPIINKKIFFEDTHLYKELASIHPLKVILSAGDSYNVSFRASSHEEYNAPMTEFLEMTGLKIEKTLLLNCYPFGISLPGAINAIDIGSRGKLLNKILDNFSPHYETIVLLIQPHFLKYYLDTHALLNYKNNIDISKTFIILGGHWFPASLSDYLAKCFQSKTDIINSRLFSSYGCAEVGLGIGTQTPMENKLRKSFASSSLPIAPTDHFASTPMILRVNTQKFFLEEIEQKIIVTPINTDSAFPLLRYDLGDFGYLKDNRLYLHERVKNPNISKLQEIILLDPQIHGLVNLKFKISPDTIRLQVYKKEHNEIVNACIKKHFPEFDIEIINLDQDDIHLYNPMLKIRYE